MILPEVPPTPVNSHLNLTGHNAALFSCKRLGRGVGESFGAGATVALNTIGIKLAKKFSDQAADSTPQAPYTPFKCSA